MQGGLEHLSLDEGIWEPRLSYLTIAPASEFGA